MGRITDWKRLNCYALWAIPKLFIKFQLPQNRKQDYPIRCVVTPALIRCVVTPALMSMT